VEMWL